MKQLVYGLLAIGGLLVIIGFCIVLLTPANGTTVVDFRREINSLTNGAIFSLVGAVFAGAAGVIAIVAGLRILRKT